MIYGMKPNETIEKFTEAELKIYSVKAWLAIDYNWTVDEDSNLLDTLGFWYL